ncbi:MAG: LysR family transcriptional regulator [Rhizobiaceae bacterium]|nr:MAG: LysR family transcriptional regulator [Rhizobiaceae bacterium]
MSDLDWNLIKAFLAVARTGSLSAAARTLGASQPTLGRHVAELEAVTGLTLFRRGRAGYELTESGIALMERAEEVADRATAFSRLALGQATETVSGTVRIAASEIVSAYVLPEMLQRLLHEEPSIEIELVASNRVENLLRRDADIAIRMVEPAQLDLVARHITDIPLVTCATKAYLDEHGVPRTLADLAGHELAGFDRDTDIIAAFRHYGFPVDRHAFRFRCDNQIALWEAVRAGNGIGFGQEPLARRDPAIGIVLPELKLPRLPLWLAMHRDVRTSARIRRVADFLHGELKRYASS